MAKHVDVLVGNVLQMQKVQIPQGLQIHPGRLGILNSLEVEVQEVIVHGSCWRFYLGQNTSVVIPAQE